MKTPAVTLRQEAILAARQGLWSKRPGPDDPSDAEAALDGLLDWFDANSQRIAAAPNTGLPLHDDFHRRIEDLVCVLRRDTE